MKHMTWMLSKGFISMGMEHHGRNLYPEGSTEDARSGIYRAINRKKKRMAKGVFDRILGMTEKETKRKAVEQAKAYILGNWPGIMFSVKAKDGNVRCSAEGHVSHS